jgi:hypothetical protein
MRRHRDNFQGRFRNDPAHQDAGRSCGDRSAGRSNTVILVGLPRGEHTVRIEAVEPEGRPFIARTVTFIVPGPASSSR